MVDETDDNMVDEMVDDSERVVVVPVQSSSYDPSYRVSTAKSSFSSTYVTPFNVTSN